MPLRITVDHGLCVGNAQCVGLAPAVFQHNENRQSEVVDPAGAGEATVLKAASYCPTGAIRVEDARTGETLFPEQGGQGPVADERRAHPSRPGTSEGERPGRSS